MCVPWGSSLGAQCSRRVDEEYSSPYPSPPYSAVRVHPSRLQVFYPWVMLYMVFYFFQVRFD